MDHTSNIPPPLSIEIETRTPLWTGGSLGTSEQLRLTSLLGGLRWWYAVLLRSVGAHVCTNKCAGISDPRKLCDLCQLFGSTDWARCFSLRLDGDLRQTRPPGLLGDDHPFFSVSPRLVSPERRRPRWYLASLPLTGKVTMTILPRRQSLVLEPSTLMAGLFQFVADWGSLGAKKGLGFGWMEMVPRQQEALAVLLDHLKAKQGERLYPNEASLQNFIYAEASSQKSGLQQGLDFRYSLRGMFREDEVLGESPTLRHMLMGYLGRHQGRLEQYTATIAVSSVDSLVRLWGWIPETLPDEIPRAEVLNAIYYHLADHYGEEDLFWKEYRGEPLMEYMQTMLLGA